MYCKAHQVLQPICKWRAWRQASGAPSASMVKPAADNSSCDMQRMTQVLPLPQTRWAHVAFTGP